MKILLLTIGEVEINFALALSFYKHQIFSKVKLSATSHCSRQRAGACSKVCLESGFATLKSQGWVKLKG